MCAILLVVVGFLVNAQAPAQLQPIKADPELAALAERWEPLRDLYDVAGCAVVVINDGVPYVWTTGVRDPRSGLPVTSNTMFYIASITKVYTAAAVMKLVEDGRVSLSDPVTKYLPDLALGESPDGTVKAHTVTIEDLITHRQGLYSAPVVWLDAYSGTITDSRYTHWLARGTADGSVRYTNVNLTLAGMIIERATGMGWRDYLDEAFFEPLGLDRTTGYASELFDDENVAMPTVWDGERWVIPDSQFKTDRTMHAAGGLGTSAADAATWMMLQLNRGEVEVDGNLARVLKTTTIDSMHELHAPFDQPKDGMRTLNGFGYGWNVGTYYDHTALSSHDGGYAGVKCSMSLLSEENSGVMVMTVGDGFTNAWCTMITADVLACITGLSKYDDPNEHFTRQIRSFKESEDRPVSGGIARASTGNFSRPIGLYTGVFYNDRLGGMVIERDGDKVTARLGDLYLDIEQGQEPDLLVIPLGHEPSTLVFHVNAYGYVNELTLTDSDLGRLVFRR